jgi:hypothetical protein
MMIGSQPLRVTDRKAACAAESAFVLPVVLFVLFSILDLGLATIRYNSLADASRRIAREAIIHGSLARAEVGSWGPASFTGTAADDSPICESIRSTLPTMNRQSVSVTVTWPDADNGPRDRVIVEVTYPHQTMIPFLSSSTDIALRSLTTMNIVN